MSDNRQTVHPVRVSGFIGSHSVYPFGCVWMGESGSVAQSVEDARRAPYGADVRAVAVWMGESGSVYTWPQAITDNRRSRVLARIERYGMESPLAGSLTIVRRKAQ